MAFLYSAVFGEKAKGLMLKIKVKDNDDCGCSSIALTLLSTRNGTPKMAHLSTGAVAQLQKQ